MEYDKVTGLGLVVQAHSALLLNNVITIALMDATGEEYEPVGPYTMEDLPDTLKNAWYVFFNVTCEYARKCSEKAIIAHKLARESDEAPNT